MTEGEFAPFIEGLIRAEDDCEHDPVMMKSMTVSDRISPELRERFEKSPYVPDMLDEMLILYEQGQSYTGIARKLKISYPTVKKYIEIAREYGFFDKGC